MRVTVRLFARLRDLAGTPALVLDLVEGSTVGAAFDAVVQLHPALGPHRAIVTAACNAAHTGFDRALSEGDEVALFPPFSGG
jgi:molybdopterin converting factor small subunit